MLSKVFFYIQYTQISLQGTVSTKKALQVGVLVKAHEGCFAPEPNMFDFRTDCRGQGELWMTFHTSMWQPWEWPGMEKLQFEGIGQVKLSGSDSKWFFFLYAKMSNDKLKHTHNLTHTHTNVVWLKDPSPSGATPKFHQTHVCCVCAPAWHQSRFVSILVNVFGASASILAEYWSTMQQFSTKQILKIDLRMPKQNIQHHVHGGSYFLALHLRNVNRSKVLNGIQSFPVFFYILQTTSYYITR